MYLFHVINWVCQRTLKWTQVPDRNCLPKSICVTLFSNFCTQTGRRKTTPRMHYTFGIFWGTKCLEIQKITGNHVCQKNEGRKPNLTWCFMVLCVDFCTPHLRASINNNNGRIFAPFSEGLTPPLNYETSKKFGYVIKFRKRNKGREN